MNTITDLYKDRITAIARAKNLAVIISKWEVVYNNPDIELVDITDKIVAFFELSDKIKEVPDHEPVKDTFFIND